MSYRQKQGTTKFIKKSGGSDPLAQASQLGKPSSSTDFSVQPPIDQLMASVSKDSAGYKLRSSDKKLAQSILDEIPLLDQKLQKTLRGIAVSRRFRNFETLVEKDPSLALKILEERAPEVMKQASDDPAFVAPVAPVVRSLRSSTVAPVDDPVLRSSGRSGRPVAPALRT